MISTLTVDPAGNAIQLWINPPVGATRWRLLRKPLTDFVGTLHQSDPDARLIYEGDSRFLIDHSDLTNGVPVWYRVDYLVPEPGSASASATETQTENWRASESRSITPSTSYENAALDAIGIVRERIDLGLQTLVDRNLLQHPAQHVPTLLATPMLDDAVFPLVTVHLASMNQTDRFIGEVFAPDVEEVDGGLVASDGWLMRHQIAVVAWSTNGDTRAALRQALLAVVQANLGVFEDAGLAQIEVQCADVDDMQTYHPIPMYQTICTLTCVAPAVVTHHMHAVAEVITASNSASPHH